MTIGPIDESQRVAARVAGLAYLITFAIVMYVNFGIHRRLIVWNNAPETARNIRRTNNSFVSASPAISFTARAF